MWFCVSIDHFTPVWLAFVVLDTVSSVPSQDIGWENVSDMIFFVSGGT